MTFLLSSAAYTLCSLFQDKDLLEIFPFLEKTRKTAKKRHMVICGPELRL